MIHNPNIDSGKGFDWGKVSEDYGRYRDIYPKEFYDKIIGSGLCTKGQRVLDLGTGTGVLPRNLYSYGASFTGADISPEQISQAVRMSEEKGMDIDYLVSSAEEIDFPENTFDVITACQCFFYFDQEKLLPNIKSMLKPDGRLVLLFFAWLPDESPIALASEQLVLKYSPEWSGKGMKRSLHEIPGWLDRFGFCTEQNTGFDINVSFTKESWNGRMKACRGVGASLSPEEVAAFETEHLNLLDSLTDQNTFLIPHYATMLVLVNIK